METKTINLIKPPVWFCIACPLVLGTLVPLALNEALGAVWMCYMV